MEHLEVTHLKNWISMMLRYAKAAVPSLLIWWGSGCSREAASVSGPSGQSMGPSQNHLVPITNMVLIKAGSFVRQKHTVTLTQDFWLNKFEVTQSEYTALMGNNPSHFTDGGTNCPVEKVNQIQAMRYCETLSQRERDGGRLTSAYEYRLPTEAEWEYACRAGTTNLYSFGDDAAVADQYAWTSENSNGKTHPVGQKRPNPWGLYDMHGNVWEWTLDWFMPYPASDLTDPTGPAQGKFKVFRGGGWNNEVAMARSANRFMMNSSNGIYFVGFRVALGTKRP
jgi:formylglycine-generating enzyme required for sulfatase activity